MGESVLVYEGADAKHAKWLTAFVPSDGQGNVADETHLVAVQDAQPLAISLNSNALESWTMRTTGRPFIRATVASTWPDSSFANDTFGLERNRYSASRPATVASCRGKLSAGDAAIASTIRRARASSRRSPNDIPSNSFTNASRLAFAVLRTSPLDHLAATLSIEMCGILSIA